MYQHILIPTDGSDLSAKAVREGIDLAKSVNARVTLFTASLPYHAFAAEPSLVVDTPEKYSREVEERAKQRLRFGEEYARSVGVKSCTRHVYAEQPFQAIIDASRKEGCDLVCMASHGRKGIAAFVLGSETAKVLTHSKVPVLVCR